jgi:hypothetical protein
MLDRRRRNQSPGREETVADADPRIARGDALAVPVDGEERVVVVAERRRA